MDYQNKKGKINRDRDPDSRHINLLQEESIKQRDITKKINRCTL